MSTAFFRFIDDECRIARSVSPGEWIEEAFRVGSGAHEFKWVCSRNDTDWVSPERVLVDQVNWIHATPLSPVYRFYSGNYKGHFFTMDAHEMAGLSSTNPNWKYEGVALYALNVREEGSVPVHRFYSHGYRAHFYTIDEAEIWTIRLTNPNWRYEGVAFHSWDMPTP